MTFLRDYLGSHVMDSGESSVPRVILSANNLGIGTQAMRLTYWTARKTETVKSIRTLTSGTAASGLTKAALAVYSVASNGDLTLVASTANDTNLWIATHTQYTKDFSSTWTKTRGQRYATGLWMVGTTSPTFYGINWVVSGNDIADELTYAPRISGQVYVPTDLPSTVSSASVNRSTLLHYSALIPA